MPPGPGASSDQEPENQANNRPATVIRAGSRWYVVQATQKQGNVDVAPEGIGIAASEEIYRNRQCRTQYEEVKKGTVACWR